MDPSKSLSCVHQQMFENRPETESREKCESADDQNGGNQQSGAQPSGNGEGTSGFGNGFLSCEASGDGQHWNNHEEAAEELSNSGGGVVPHSVGADPGKG